MQNLPGGVRVSLIPTTVGMVGLSPGIIPPPGSEGGPGGPGIGIIVPFLLGVLLPFLAPVLVEAPTPPPVVSPAPPSVPPSAGSVAAIPGPVAAIPGPVATVPVPAPIVLPSTQQRPPVKPKVAVVSAAQERAPAQAQPQLGRTVLPFTGAVAAGYLIPGATLLSLGVMMRSRRLIRPRPSLSPLESVDPWPKDTASRVVKLFKEPSPFGLALDLSPAASPPLGPLGLRRWLRTIWSGPSGRIALRALDSLRVFGAGLLARVRR